MLSQEILSLFQRNAYRTKEFCPNNDCNKTGFIIRPIFRKTR